MRIDLQGAYQAKWNQSPENVSLSLVHNFTLSFCQVTAAISQADMGNPLGYLMTYSHLREMDYKPQFSYLIPAMDHIFRFYTHPNEGSICIPHLKSESIQKRNAILVFSKKHHKPIDLMLPEFENKNDMEVVDRIINKDIMLQNLDKESLNFACYLYFLFKASPEQCKLGRPPDFNVILPAKLYHVCEQGYKLFQTIVNDYYALYFTLDEIMILNKYGIGALDKVDLICRLSEGIYHDNLDLIYKIKSLSATESADVLKELSAGIRYSPPFFSTRRKAVDAAMDGHGEKFGY